MEWIILWIICAVIAGSIAGQKKAGRSGCCVGLLLGPLGVLVACFLDERRQCGECGSRIESIARICPFCRTRVVHHKKRRTLVSSFVTGMLIGILVVALLALWYVLSVTY